MRRAAGNQWTNAAVAGNRDRRLNREDELTMKKIIALLLAATMLLGMITAFAEDEAKEITWQDIPWGSSFDGVHQIMTDKGIYNPSSTTVMQGKHANSIMSGLAGAFLLENGDIEEEWYSDKYIKSEIRHLVYFAPEVVAGGYNVKTLIFTFSPDDKLMTIVVGIDTNDFWTKSPALRAKLP